MDWRVSDTIASTSEASRSLHELAAEVDYWGEDFSDDYYDNFGLDFYSLTEFQKNADTYF